MNDIDTLIEFLNMPLSSVDKVFNKFASINGAVQRGKDLQRFLYIEGTRQNKVLLVAHADTVWDEHYGKYDHKIQNISYDNGIIHNNNGGLGADDRAGCAILWLLKDMGHSILITHGEEHGREGSRWLMKHNTDIADAINSHHRFIIQLDRRNGTDFKCYNVGTDEFRSYIKSTIGYTEPDLCSNTDIVDLCRNICGVNLSIGYYKEHTENEHLIVQEWLNTLNICRNWIVEPTLPPFPYSLSCKSKFK